MIGSVPAGIDVAAARLPQTYERAKQALAECNSIDECQDWADKAAALASYAKQADDDQLHKHAVRIQARAVRRVGELLRTYNTGVGRNGAANDTISQRQAASGAGLSKRQEVMAVRVAKVPPDTFEDTVENGESLTVSGLAEMGKITGRPGFRQATAALATLERFAKFCAENDPLLVAQGVLPHETKEASRQVAAIDAWLDRFVVNLKG